MKNIRTTLAAAAALVAALAFTTGAARAQDTTPVTASSVSQNLNDAFAGTGRLGVGAIGVLGNNGSGSIAKGLSFQQTDAVLTLDVLRYKTPIGGLKGETSLGVYLSTNDINLKNGSFGPQVNYSLGRVFVGVAYVPTHGENKGQFIIGHRL
jgi:hypothetical protein